MSCPKAKIPNIWIGFDQMSAWLYSLCLISNCSNLDAESYFGLHPDLLDIRFIEDNKNVKLYYIYDTLFFSSILKVFKIIICFSKMYILHSCFTQQGNSMTIHCKLCKTFYHQISQVVSIKYKDRCDNINFRIFIQNICIQNISCGSINNFNWFY